MWTDFQPPDIKAFGYPAHPYDMHVCIPELVHVPHLRVQHGEEAEQKVAANHVWEVEGEIPPEIFYSVFQSIMQIQIYESWKM